MSVIVESDRGRWYVDPVVSQPNGFWYLYFERTGAATVVVKEASPKYGRDAHRRYLAGVARRSGCFERPTDGRREYRFFPPEWDWTTHYPAWIFSVRLCARLPDALIVQHRGRVMVPPNAD